MSSPAATRNARLRVAGLSDEAAKGLPTQLHAASFERMQLSTWRTDAGDIGILADMPNRAGELLGDADLAPRAVSVSLASGTILPAALDDVIASKEFADRPKDHDALPELRQLRRAQLAEHPHPFADRADPEPAAIDVGVDLEADRQRRPSGS